MRQGFDSPNNGGANLVSFEEQIWFRFLLDCPHEEGERRCEKRHETRGGVRTEGVRARRKLRGEEKGRRQEEKAREWENGRGRRAAERKKGRRGKNRERARRRRKNQEKAKEPGKNKTTVSLSHERTSAVRLCGKDPRPAGLCEHR